MNIGSTSTPLTRLLGACTLIAVGVLLWLGLVVTPADVVQGELVRLIYLHPALATAMYLAFGTTAAASALYLYPRTRSRFWDLLAGASAEIGVVFCALVLVTGSIWGRPTWGVWWTWDARLTSSALLLTLFIGYLALRRIPGDASARARRSAIAALIAIIDVPIVHFSVEWWRTLHQGATLKPVDADIEGLQLVALLFSFATFGLIFSWLLVHRFRLERLESRYEGEALDVALAERRAEASSQRPEAKTGSRQSKADVEASVEVDQ